MLSNIKTEVNSNSVCEILVYSLKTADLGQRSEKACLYQGERWNSSALLWVASWLGKSNYRGASVFGCVVWGTVMSRECTELVGGVLCEAVYGIEDAMPATACNP